MGLFGTGVRRICAVVAASTAAEMSKMVRSALRQTRTVELRLDWLSSDAERARFLDWLGKGQPRNATFLAACRRRDRKSTRLNSSHEWISYAVFCLKKK